MHIQCISISLFRPIHSDTGYYPVSVHVSDQFNNTSLAQSCVVLRRDKRYRRRESKNVGFHNGVTRRARTRRKVEGSRPAWQEIGFVCEIPRAESTSRFTSSSVIFLALESRICSACPSRPDRNLSRMVREFTTKVLLARTWPYFIYLVRIYSTDSYISTKLPLTIFQGDCLLNSSL